MSKKELLIEKIKENNGVITTKQVIEYGIHKDVLKNMVIKEELEKIANGLYVFLEKVLMNIYTLHIEFRKEYFLMKPQLIYMDLLQDCHSVML